MEIVKNCHEWFYLNFAKLYFAFELNDLTILEMIYKPYRDFDPSYHPETLDIQFFVPEVRAYLPERPSITRDLVNFKPEEYEQEILFFFNLAWEDMLCKQLSLEKPLR